MPEVTLSIIGSNSCEITSRLMTDNGLKAKSVLFQGKLIIVGNSQDSAGLKKVAKGCEEQGLMVRISP